MNVLSLVQDFGDMDTLLICRRHEFAYLVSKKEVFTNTEQIL